VNEIAAFAIRELDKLTTVSGSGREIAQAASEVMDGILLNIEKRHNREKIDYGLQTGINKVDNLFKGLKPGWLVYLAGSPGIGKSMLALQWAMVFAKQAPGSYVALEMSEDALLFRAYSMKMGDDPTDVEFGNVDSTKIISAYSEMEDLDIHLFCPARLTIQELKAYISKQKAERGIKWIVLDYVSLVDVPRTNDKVADDEYLSTELRKIASEYNVMLLGLDSVTKAGATGYLSLDAIRGSFTKQHDADISFGYSQLKDKEIDKERLRNCRGLGVLKDRHRGNGGRMFSLELKDGLIDGLKDETEFVVEDWTK
jgi:replicative DNA helicase